MSSIFLPVKFGLFFEKPTKVCQLGFNYSCLVVSCYRWEQGVEMSGLSSSLVSPMQIRHILLRMGSSNFDATPPPPLLPFSLSFFVCLLYMFLFFGCLGCRLRAQFFMWFFLLFAQGGRLIFLSQICIYRQP